ncbi:MAG: type III-A CRISPR-associated protein Csm2 [Caldilineaceae bacterium]|nr:type III-A CRISPR-associated protein Csm2 [Caldilineaceae bacterium]
MSELQSSLDTLKGQGFYDASGRVRPELFDQVARTLGRSFAQGDKRVRVSSSQLRGFYGDLKALEEKLREMSRDSPESERNEGGITEAVYHKNEYLVRMVVPKVAYIQGKRTGGNVSQEFRDFIEKAIEQVHSATDFTVFMRLFESVVGFFYGYNGGRNQ